MNFLYKTGISANAPNSTKAAIVGGVLAGLVAHWIAGRKVPAWARGLMPVLVIVFGPLQAVPIMAIAAIMANLSRIAVWWREVDWRVTAAYSATGIPAAALQRAVTDVMVRTEQTAEQAAGAALAPLRQEVAAAYIVQRLDGSRR